MKILIAYYSKTKNTEELAEVLKKEFERRGHNLEIEKIEPLKEHSSFIWFLIRCFIWETDIQTIKFENVFSFDRICIGSPNWTIVSLPVARYLKEINGLEDKKVGIFYTSAGFPQEVYLELYLPYATFRYRVRKKGGKIVSKLFLSSSIPFCKIESKYGQKVIKKFCDEIER